MANQKSVMGRPPRMKAVHRIEGGGGMVLEPGAFFHPPDPEEMERLLRLGAAVLAEEPAEEVIQES